MKFKKLGQTEKLQFTDTDLPILNIKLALDLVNYQCAELDSKIDRVQAEARNAVKEKQLSKAKLLLKQKRALQTLSEKRLISKLNLDEILERIRSAKSEKTVFEAYKSGCASLKSLNSELNLDDVENVMDTLQDAIADQAEISNALSGEINDLDDEEVHRELELLQANETAQVMHSLEQLEALSVNQAPLESVIPVKNAVTCLILEG